MQYYCLGHMVWFHQSQWHMQVHDRRRNGVRKMVIPAVWAGLIPIPSSVIIALVSVGTLNWNKTWIHIDTTYEAWYSKMATYTEQQRHPKNKSITLTSSAANFKTAMKGVISGTLNLQRKSPSLQMSPQLQCNNEIHFTCWYYCIGLARLMRTPTHML